MTVDPKFDDQNDQFPIGMRVLAVDDDPTCLLLLETLLRRCQYHVTTTNQAIMALKLLRENKNKFDLVISDVHMPDMDGFKLLEHVGLEMDLPVIMLSANGDTKLVMKGITHGACDYLVKPVRIEELKNIWQHVIRRRKFDKKNKVNYGNQEDPCFGGHEEAPGVGNADQSGKLYKRRMDQNEDDNDEGDESGQNNEDLSTQKKPRVVWSVELHRKFVNAVNQLGIDKAVPKKILDLMNVEKLTRENVASHLQKYRLYLKRISSVANQQANMLTALGSADSSYLRLCSLNGIGKFPTISGSPQFPNVSLRSVPSAAMFNRLNTSACMSVHGLSSSGNVSMGNSGGSSFDQPISQPLILPSGNVLQGIPLASGLDQPQFKKHPIHSRDFSSPFTAKASPVPSGLPDAKTKASGSSNHTFGLSTNPVMPEGLLKDTPDGRKFGHQHPDTVGSLRPGVLPPFPDDSSRIENWPNAVQPPRPQPSSFPSSDCSQHALLYLRNLGENTSSLQFLNNPDVSCLTSLPTQLQNSTTDLQEATTSSDYEPKAVNIPHQRWDDNRQEAFCYSNMVRDSSSNPLVPVNAAIQMSGLGMKNGSTAFNKNRDLTASGQSSFVSTGPINHDDLKKPAGAPSLHLKQGRILDQQKHQASFASNNFGSLEDLARAMMKQDKDKVKSLEGDFGHDSYSVGTYGTACLR